MFPIRVASDLVITVLFCFATCRISQRERLLFPMRSGELGVNNVAYQKLSNSQSVSKRNSFTQNPLNCFLCFCYWSCRLRVFPLFLYFPIDLSTDTAAMLNLLDLRSIMGCPWGTRSVFMCAFRAKREFQCMNLGKKAIIITSYHGATIFFPIAIFFYENLKKNWPEKRA